MYIIELLKSSDSLNWDAVTVMYCYDYKDLTTLCMFAEYHVMYFGPVAFIYPIIFFCIFLYLYW